MHPGPEQIRNHFFNLEVLEVDSVSMISSTTQSYSNKFIASALKEESAAIQFLSHLRDNARPHEIDLLRRGFLVSKEIERDGWCISRSVWQCLKNNGYTTGFNEFMEANKRSAQQNYPSLQSEIFAYYDPLKRTWSTSFGDNLPTFLSVLYNVNIVLVSPVGCMDSMKIEAPLLDTENVNCIFVYRDHNHYDSLGLLDYRDYFNIMTPHLERETSSEPYRDLSEEGPKFDWARHKQDYKDLKVEGDLKLTKEELSLVQASLTQKKGDDTKRNKSYNVKVRNIKGYKVKYNKLDTAKHFDMYTKSKDLVKDLSYSFPAMVVDEQDKSIELND